MESHEAPYPAEDVSAPEYQRAIAARDALRKAKADLDALLEVLRGASGDLQDAVIDLREASLTLQGAALMSHPDLSELRSVASTVEAQERGPSPLEGL